MKHFLKLLMLLFFTQYAHAQAKAIPPYEPEQLVRNIIQELDIPDDTFNKMRGRDNIIQLKLFLNDKGEPVKLSIPDDEFNLAPFVFSAIKQLPNFTPVTVDGTPKNSMYNLSFVINEYNYYKAVRQTAVPEVGMEKFAKKVRDNFYITDLERVKLSAAKTKENYDVIIDFIIEKDGSLSSFKMRDKEMEYFQDRMVRALKRASKKWTPGKLNGESVRTRSTYTLTIKADFHSLNI